MNNHPQKYFSSPGFTLLEMLFAVIIFSFALVSLMTIAGKGVAATAGARDQLTAEFLAEELLEVARNTRDSNYVDSVAPWDDGISQCIDTACDVEYATPKPFLIVCDDEQCADRQLFVNDGAFQPDPAFGEPTTFYRQLQLTAVTADQYVMEATVYWKQKNLDRQMVVRTYIANW